LNRRSLAPELVRQLERNGVALGVEGQDLAKVRKREIARLKTIHD
jgi:hypothetical protein